MIQYWKAGHRMSFECPNCNEILSYGGYYDNDDYFSCNNCFNAIWLRKYLITLMKDKQELEEMEWNLKPESQFTNLPTLTVDIFKQSKKDHSIKVSTAREVNTKFGQRIVLDVMFNGTSYAYWLNSSAKKILAKNFANPDKLIGATIELETVKMVVRGNAVTILLPVDGA